MRYHSYAKMFLVTICSVSMMGLFGMCEEKKKSGTGGSVGGASSEEDHGGSEHAGDAHTKIDFKHKFDDNGNQIIFSAAEIKQKISTHIASNQSKNNGIFRIYDKDKDQVLSLKFVKIHNPVRKVKGKGYFACADFQVVGSKGKLYDLDFWLTPTSGELRISQERVHKDPVLKAGKWDKKPRYTFINDNPTVVK